ncbi:LytTR family transcriptional regulator DNA-binding domain-containing protein [Sedimentibacter sp. zth1]|uniref:LytR/AlgR family response regulator transcription factor n=1 Tax=Sedimentibacter sp. zth1 TaxID=2816908 RepID=UPI001A90F928|nr:LytTR family transcriptional regulator DNA-binding domain-containing protein [Sedimentibacter sp. zth1]QSX05816.1 LytTR family transcriptional regulator DNA-binding domain-containing protein [Sedimentibacter sp. zth1]
MLNIVICDDDNEMCLNLKKSLIQNIEFEFKLHIFHDYDLNFHEYILYNNIPSIYIFDIELNNTNVDGYGIAKKVRKAKSYSDEIIFLSSYTSGIINTYKYKIKPIDFIEKSSYCYLDVISAVNEAKLRIDARALENDSGALLINEGKDTYRIKYKNIICIEKIKNCKKVEITVVKANDNLDKNIYTTYKAIEKIYEELDDRFSQISRGVIINKKFVKKVSSNGQVVMANGNIFMTSVKKTKELKDEL